MVPRLGRLLVWSSMGLLLSGCALFGHRPRVFEGPATWGPFPVGQVELNDPNGISGITDPTGTTGPTQSITLAWARIMYPAVTAGAGTPVSAVRSRYPVALFLHGRHFNCDTDGSGPGLVGSYSFAYPVANRIPSHEGYNYIMERLASQGIFSISISAHDIQPGLGAWDHDARGRLILKFLDKLKDWTVNGTDPFGGIFAGKLDMARIALAGHSRGGEGVVAAQQLNKTWPTTALHCCRQHDRAHRSERRVLSHDRRAVLSACRRA